jgi:hypothetical protein
MADVQEDHRSDHQISLDESYVMYLENDSFVPKERRVGEAEIYFSQASE